MPYVVLNLPLCPRYSLTCPAFRDDFHKLDIIGLVALFGSERDCVSGIVVAFIYIQLFVSAVVAGTVA